MLNVTALMRALARSEADAKSRLGAQRSYCDPAKGSVTNAADDIQVPHYNECQGQPQARHSSSPSLSCLNLWTPDILR